MTTKTKFVSELADLRPSSMFLTIHKYKNEAGEVADYNLVFHMSYKSALEKSLNTLSTYVPENDLEKQAKEELIASYVASLAKIEETPLESLDDGYIRYFQADGSHIKGIKLHEDSNTLHLYGLLVNKRVIEQGVYKKTNKRPLTIAKDKLKKDLPVNKFRQFKITPDQVEKITVQNMDILPPV